NKSRAIDISIPPHETAIGKREGATNKPFARFWVHVEYLLVNAEKMTKSLGNTHTLPDIVARGYRIWAARVRPWWRDVIASRRSGTSCCHRIIGNRCSLPGSDY